MAAFVSTFAVAKCTRASRRTHLQCCANSINAETNALPTSLEDTVSLATKAISHAIQAGHKRIGVNALIPGLNPVIEQTVPYSSSSLNILAKGLVQYTPELNATPSSSLLFSSAGTAAAATAQYARSTVAEGQPAEESQGTAVSTSSYSKRDFNPGRTSPCTNVIVAPISSRGDPIMDDLEKVIAESPDSTWLLLNPQLGEDRAAVGIQESSRRAAFSDTFVNAFYFRNLVRKTLLLPNLHASTTIILVLTYPWKSVISVRNSTSTVNCYWTWCITFYLWSTMECFCSHWWSIRSGWATTIHAWCWADYNNHNSSKCQG